MYQYTEFDHQFVQQRAAQHRDQLQRWQAGQLSDEEFRPLRLQNGWYVQRYAPMLRVAVPYGEISSAQLSVLSRIAREFDTPDSSLFAKAQAQQDLLAGKAPRLTQGYGHFTTRQNVQFNWIALERSADVMDLLASVNMHGIQTSGNCIRNITTDELAGVGVDEVADPRPYAEILRQWSSLHPEFAYLPRKFKIAITGAKEDRAAIGWHDVGLQLVKNDQDQVGFKIYVGGGMGRTPMIGSLIRDFLPWQEIMNYLEAVLRVYNRWGRRDNIYKARIKILVKALGQRYIDEVETEYQQIVHVDGAAHTLSQVELERISASFVPPEIFQSSALDNRYDSASVDAVQLQQQTEQSPAFARWHAQNVAPHKNPALRAVTLSFKRLGLAVGLASANIGLLSDMIACPGGDYCALANARAIPVADAISERYQDLDELFDLGPIDLHISGCINSCGHHHSGHIGILGVDKDGKEWYQVTLGGSDGSNLSGPAGAGKVIGPSFSSDEVPDVIEAVIDVYRQLRQSLVAPNSSSEQVHGRAEFFIDTLHRVGLEPFKQAAHAARHASTDDAQEREPA